MVMNEGSHNSACDSCTTVMSMVDISVFACGMALPKGYVIMRISAWIWNAKQAYKIYNYIYLIILYLQAFCWWLDVACSSDFFPVLVLVPFLWWICACKSQRTIKTAAFEEFPDCSHTHTLSLYIYIYTRIRRELSAVRHLRFCQCLTCSVGSSKHHAHYSEYQNQDYAISI